MYIYQQRIQRPNTLLYSEKYGTGDPLVLIHGLGGSGRWWERNTDALVKQFQVHSIDLLGCGKSAVQGRFVLREAAQHVKHWMEAHHLRRAHVVGHSMGGFVAAELAADYPEMVEKLVLVDAALLPPEQMTRPNMCEVVESLRNLPKNFGPTRLSDILTMGLENVVIAAQAMMQTDIRQKLLAIKASTLIIWGQQDVMVPISVGKSLARYLPTKKFVVINRAGHCPMWDRPDVFNRVVSNFLCNEREPLMI
jgi:pimeloyl-ACP methyl ester carboxylesterase